ncbi:MAG: type II secretion system F family protein, partial [Gammaproteobacteria bacterium]|nr:type II secretion system F family protein [Gammaproteobacteria bacterium]
MACYLWYGEDTSLQLQQGVLQARGVSHLGCQLAQQGVQLKRQFRITAWQRRRSAIKPLVACELLQQWQQLLAAGLPLLDCVRLAMPQQPSITLRWQLWLLQDRLQQGHQLSSVFAEQQLLPAYQIALLAAGERQADIGKVMGQLARQQHQTMAIAKQLKRSLLMPAITLAAGLLVCVLMLLFLVPNLASLVQSDQHSIPTATRWLLAISNGLRQSGPQLLLAGALMLSLSGLFISSQYGQVLARKIPAWLPVWRTIYQLQNE